MLLVLGDRLPGLGDHAVQQLIDSSPVLGAITILPFSGIAISSLDRLTI